MHDWVHWTLHYAFEASRDSTDSFPGRSWGFVYTAGIDLASGGDLRTERERQTSAASMSDSAQGRVVRQD